MKYYNVGFSLEYDKKRINLELKNKLRKYLFNFFT